MARIGKSIHMENKSVASKGWGERGWGMTANGQRVSLQGDEKVLKLEVVDTQHCECMKCH